MCFCEITNLNTFKMPNQKTISEGFDAPYIHSRWKNFEVYSKSLKCNFYKGGLLLQNFLRDLLQLYSCQKETKIVLKFQQSWIFWEYLRGFTYFKSAPSIQLVVGSKLKNKRWTSTNSLKKYLNIFFLRNNYCNTFWF